MTPAAAGEGGDADESDDDMSLAGDGDAFNDFDELMTGPAFSGMEEFVAASDHDLLSRSSLIAIDENIEDEEDDEDYNPPEGGAESLGAWTAKNAKKATGQKRSMHSL